MTGPGISARSAGNSAATGVADYLEFFAADPATDVSLIYVEGLADGRSFFEKARAAAMKKPIVVLKGGITAGGARAAASHTGALATNDRPVLIDFVVQRDAMVWPMVPAGVSNDKILIARGGAPLWEREA